MGLSVKQNAISLSCGNAYTHTQPLIIHFFEFSLSKQTVGLVVCYANAAMSYMYTCKSPFGGNARTHTQPLIIHFFELSSSSKETVGLSVMQILRCHTCTGVSLRLEVMHTPILKPLSISLKPFQRRQWDCPLCLKVTLPRKKVLCGND